MPVHLAPKLISWASILEDNTRDQAITTASMPFVHPHVALMPDAHLGRGATVGSVLPTDGAIIPAAVGVDIGCVDENTEYLSPTGWRRIADYNGDPVMQYDLATGTGRFVMPSAYIVKDCPEFIRLHTKYGINQMLSPDHRVLIWKIVGRDRRRVPMVISAAQFEGLHEGLIQGLKAEFETTFIPQVDTKLALSDDEIRVQVMVHADGHLASLSTATAQFRKSRKQDRARVLLAAASIDWTERSYRDGDVTFRFAPPRMTKSFGEEWWSASAEQLRVIVDEVVHWDGNADDSCFYTRDRASADFIHYAFTAAGYRGVLRLDADTSDGATDYRVFAYRNTKVGMASVPKTPTERIPSGDGKAYCFTLPSGFWVMRRDGNIAMTGNCGVYAVLTQFARADLEGTDLRDLHESIVHRVPLSAGRYNGKVQSTAEPRIAELEASAVHLGFDPALYARNWRLQLGSLGSGNHFIEITVDELDRVWLFLHSGSRGVGNKIASVHIKIAKATMKQWWITLPDPDLAYLVEGTDNFWAYITEMQWAQRFAWLNREEMMDRCVEALSRHTGRAVERLDEVHTHHNYTEREEVCTTCIDIQDSDSRLRARLLADDGFATVRDSLAGYRPSVHSCGGLILTAVGDDPADAPLPVDVPVPTLAQCLQSPDPGPARTRSGAFGPCGCADLDRTAGAYCTFSSMFGRGFGHLAEGKTEYRRLGTVLAAVLFGVAPQFDHTLGHDTRKVWLSRKGAIDASEGVRGLIPGSMGTASFVVTGKGNPVALRSSPHGAGRSFSRTAARKKFTRESLDAAMLGITWGEKDAFLDEHPEAYKPVDVIMRDAADLVSVDHTLRQILNVKGD